MNPNNDQIKKIVEGSILKADHVFEYPPVCLSILGDYGNQIFATLGNFSTILALPKVGKTTATGIIVSSLLSGVSISNFVPSLPIDKNVIVWIDTEQGKPECVKIIRSICAQVTGKNDDQPESLKFYSFRQYNKETRIAATDYIIRNTPNLGFLVIDGIRDFVTSINDEREATAIADHLLRWTQEENIHILTILHQNKGDANARGHLGTELMNKAETVSNLTRDDNNGKRTTAFEPKFTRHKDFEQFAFHIEENGTVCNTEIKSSYEPKNPKAEHLTSDQLETIAKNCFTQSKNIPYSKLWNAIKIEMVNLDLPCGDNKAKEVLTVLQSKRYIGHSPESKHYFLNTPV